MAQPLEEGFLAKEDKETKDKIEVIFQGLCG